MNVNKNMFDLTGKTALVTGAGAGLGRAIALGLACFGCSLAISDIDENTILETADLAKQYGGDVLAVRCDNSKPKEIESLFNSIDEKFGQIDILVNNVGIIARQRPEELSLEDWNRVLQINLTGTFLCTQQAGRRMIARGQGGSIVNISSTTSCSGMGRGNFVYSTTKSAINQITRELAVEWAAHKIRVNAILPAQILTAYLQAMIDNPKLESNSLVDRVLSGIPLGRLGNIEDLIGPVIFLVSDAASYITGITLPVDGGNLAFNPSGSLAW